MREDDAAEDGQQRQRQRDEATPRRSSGDGEPASGKKQDPFGSGVVGADEQPAAQRYTPRKSDAAAAMRRAAEAEAAAEEHRGKAAEEKARKRSPEERICARMKVPLRVQQRNLNAGGASVSASLPDLASATLADHRVGDLVVLTVRQQNCR
eukprot:3072879-Amphidinium_carterae.1